MSVSWSVGQFVFDLDGWFEPSYFLRQESYTSNAIIGTLVNQFAFEEVEVIFVFIFNNFAVRLICCCSLSNIYPLTLAKINRNMLEIQTPPHVEVTRGVNTISAKYIFANIT